MFNYIKIQKSKTLYKNNKILISSSISVYSSWQDFTTPNIHPHEIAMKEFLNVSNQFWYSYCLLIQEKKNIYDKILFIINGMDHAFLSTKILLISLWWVGNLIVKSGYSMIFTSFSEKHIKRKSIIYLCIY